MQQATRMIQRAWRAICWLLLAVLAVEMISFIVVVISNFTLYGNRFEGTRVRYDTYALFLNEDGPRQTTYNRKSPDSSRNRFIWMLGGSTTHGGDDDATTIPSLLSRELNSSRDGLYWTVRNFGVSSFNSLMEAKYLQKLLIEEREKPDLVIFLDGANDATYYAMHRTPDAHYGYSKVQGVIESYRRRWFGILKPLYAAAYASYTKELWDKFTQIMTRIPADSGELTRFADSEARRYEHLHRVCSAFGIRFIAFWQPTRWVETAVVTPSVRDMEKKGWFGEDRLPAYAHNTRVISDAVIKRIGSQPWFADFRNILTSRAGLVYREDGVHFRDEGAEMLAKAISNVIRKN